jgi:predicted small secreted protein
MQSELRWIAALAVSATLLAACGGGGGGGGDAPAAGPTVNAFNAGVSAVIALSDTVESQERTLVTDPGDDTADPQPVATN